MHKETEMRFKDKVAIVTGAAGGIGLATTRQLAREGARVLMADLHADKLEAARAGLVGEGVAPDDRLAAAPCNVAVEEEVGAAMQRALKAFGRVDVIINNAGTMIFKPIEQHSAQDVLQVLGVDFMGAFFFTKQAFLHLSTPGTIVNVSSIHALQTSPLVMAYAAAKAALVSLTRSAAIEGKPRGIRVNAVLPGAVETPMLRDNPNVRSGAEKLDETMVGQPADIAQAIAWLASDESAFVAGEALRVDGGRLARL
jgi:NAD(P)-dependent dehydrogenase (short-subunit alcohol dehydrogenase family)